MKYCTVLTDPLRKQERPVQAFHPDSVIAQQWAEEALAKASPQAYVTLYLTVDVAVHVFKQPTPPAPKTAA